MGKLIRFRNIFLVGLLFAAAIFIRGIVFGAGLPIPGQTLPVSGDFDQGNDIRLITAIYSKPAGFLLDAPTSTVRLYSGQRNPTLSIIDGGNCPGQNGDAGPNNNQATTTFRIWALTPNSNANYTNTPFTGINNPPIKITSSQIGCAASYPISNIGSLNAQAATVGPASGKYAFEIQATMTGSPGWNMFKYSVPNGQGRFSYYAGSGKQFALKSDQSGDPGPKGDFNLGFAPGCGLNDGDTEKVTVQWYDADAGQPNQGGQSPIKTQFIEYDNNNVATSYNVPVSNINNTSTGGSGGSAPGNGDLWITTGNQQGGEATITIRGHHKYKWVWQNIYSANGIQFELPFDSFNTIIDYNTDCVSQSPPADFSCTATAVDATDVRVTITNNASYAEGKGYQLRQSPDTLWKAGKPHTNANVEWPVAPGFNSNFLAGASTSFTYTRPANAIENYKLYDGPAGSGANIVGNNPLCSVGTGSVSATCNGSSVSNPAEVGQSAKFNFSFLATNTTSSPVTITYSSNPNPFSPAGSFSRVSPPSTPSSTIPAGTVNQTYPQPPPLTISAVVNYGGTLTAIATYNGSPIASCPQSVTPVSLPYFQVWNGDTTAGGGFASPSGSGAFRLGQCGESSSDPPYISPAVSGDNSAGGIQAFARPQSKLGSQTDFGAIALGQIAGSNWAGQAGFFSGDSSNGFSSSKGSPTFANTVGVNGVTTMGGFLDSNSPAHCVKDFFSDTRNNPVASTDPVTDINNCPGRCQFIADGTVNTVNLSGLAIHAGHQVTLYVNGDVVISGDIKYDSQFDPTNPANVPYFALIVKGNIYITSAVSRMDGLYVTQPVNNSGTWKDGVFATCDTAINSLDICNNQLVINGAVIAQQIDLLHEHGTLDPPLSNAVTAIDGRPAEIINFVPSMIVGSPDFASQFGDIQGAPFNLAPVF